MFFLFSGITALPEPGAALPAQSQVADVSGRAAQSHAGVRRSGRGLWACMLPLFPAAMLLLGLVQDAAAQAPNFQAAGAAASGTVGVSPAWPAHQIGDVAFLVMETRGNVTPTLLTANGFASVGSNNAVNSAAGTRLTVFWARATSSSMAAPVINNTTDHVYAQILTYRGVLWSGNPWNVTATGNKTTASMTANVTGVTPTDTNTLIVQIATRPNDSAAAFVTGLVNANLTSITLRSDEGTTVGDGGGFAVWDGVRALNAATGTTAANFNVSVVNAFRALALRPAQYSSRVTGSWGTAATWSTAGCGGAASTIVPPVGSDVTVCAGHTVTLNANSANLKSLTIQATGILNIGNNTTARTLTVSPTAPLPAGTIVNSGTLRYNTAGNHVITTNGTFTNNGTFTSLAGVAGTRTLTVTGLITNSSTGTITFAGNAITTVNANGGFTNDGTINVDVNSNVTHVINMRGNFINNSNNVSLRADANSLVNTVFNATVAQTVTGSVANTNFGNVTVSNANGVTLTGTHNMTVLNVFNFTVDGSIITTGANLVQIGSQPLNLVGSVTNANANRFVNGNLQRYFNATGTFNFDVGSIGANRWSPVQIQIGVAPSTAGSLRVSTASGDHAQIGSSGFDAAKTVNRTWTLTNAGLVFGANANNRVRFTFVAGDIDGTAVPANFHIGRYTGLWTLTPPPTPNAQPLFTEMSGTTITSATLTGDFQVGEKAPVVTPPDSFNAVEVGANAVTGRIFTKLRGANFTLDIVAIQGGVQHATFNEAVTIDLVTGGSGGANCGGAAVTTIAGPTDVTLAGGRVTTGTINVATAYPDVRVRIRYPVGGPYTITTCSSDNFSIKPTAFTITSTDATNTGTSTGTTIKTGANFNLTAAGGAGYAGTPSGNFSGNVAGTPNAGTIGGSFGAAVGGTASGNFYYSEVGNFGLSADAVRDTAFTATGDQAGGDCIASSTSEALSGGQYGCWIGSNAVAQTTGSSGFGRIIPDNFNVSYNTPVFATACGTFSYVGTTFSYTVTPQITVTARNGTNNGLANATTANYAGAYMKLTNTSLTPDTQAARYSRFDALGGGATPALDTAGLPAPAGDPAIGTFTNGVGVLAFASGTGLAYTRSTTTPNAPFDADIALALNVIDTDGVAFAGNPASFGAASAGGGIAFNTGKPMRYGRLAISNANGSQLVPLQIGIEAQHWAGAPSNAFITNIADSCTTIAASDIALSGYTNNLSDSPLCETAVSGGGVLSAGRRTLLLAAPGSGNNGSVTLTVNLGSSASGNTCATVGAAPGPATTANRPHLQGKWSGAAYDQNPAARATFGVYRGSEEVIHIREMY